MDSSPLEDTPVWRSADLLATTVILVAVFTIKQAPPRCRCATRKQHNTRSTDAQVKARTKVRKDMSCIQAAEYQRQKQDHGTKQEQTTRLQADNAEADHCADAPQNTHSFA